MVSADYFDLSLDFAQLQFEEEPDPVDVVSALIEALPPAPTEADIPKLVELRNKIRVLDFPTVEHERISHMCEEVIKRHCPILLLPQELYEPIALRAGLFNFRRCCRTFNALAPLTLVAGTPSFLEGCLGNPKRLQKIADIIQTLLSAKRDGDAEYFMRQFSRRATQEAKNGLWQYIAKNGWIDQFLPLFKENRTCWRELSSPGTDPKSVEALAKLLSSCPDMRRLSLVIDTEGGKDYWQARGVANLTKLESLTVVRLKRASLPDPEGLAGLSSLTEFEAPNCSLTKREITALSRLPLATLRKVYVVEPLQLVRLKGLKALELMFDLYSSNETFRALKELTSVTSLTLHECESGRSYMPWTSFELYAEPLLQMPQLRLLRIFCPKRNPEELPQSLLSAIQKLRSLEVLELPFKR